jgi:hypothetical protein
MAGHYAHRGMLREATAAMEKAIRLRPKEPRYRTNLAALLVAAGRNGEAFDQLRTVYDEPIAHYDLGYLLNRQGQKQAAVQQFSIALQLNPGLVYARQYLDRLAVEGVAVNRPATPQTVQEQQSLAPQHDLAVQQQQAVLQQQAYQQQLAAQQQARLQQPAMPQQQPAMPQQQIVQQLPPVAPQQQQLFQQQMVRQQAPAQQMSQAIAPQWSYPSAGGQSNAPATRWSPPAADSRTLPPQMAISPPTNAPANVQNGVGPRTQPAANRPAVEIADEMPGPSNPLQAGGQAGVNVLRSQSIGNPAQPPIPTDGPRTAELPNYGGNDPRY